MKLLKKLSTSIIVLGILLLLLTYFPVIRDEIWYQLQSKSREASKNEEEYSAFAGLLFSKPLTMDPVNKDFGLIIEKIGVNVPVIADVPVMDEKAYEQALKEGVAHASSSDYPSNSPGNVYIFAHASVNFWQLGKYATVFNLLRKLDTDDVIHLFYEGKDHTYIVVNKEVVKGWNTFPLQRSVIEPLLTLQTCDPPGTTLNRLVVTAKLSNIK